VGEERGIAEGAQQGSAAGVIGLERFEMIRVQAFEVHAHEAHQAQDGG
jgi:hypothetical protein